ncbi:MAG TPA: thiol reductant ABC exporter subunit CydC [Gaiellaceae bacterium]|nr:thiol reductant ABC exporter subunit CydC [Gaiellaceae bacterium]
MTGRVLALTRAPRGRLALAAGLGAFTICCGIGLMATAGYLISRAAERPAIVSLSVAIVGVRFFGLARPLARYFERLASHDVAFRVLRRVRLRVFRRIEPLAPTQLDCYRRGDLLSRFVADVDALQNIQLRGTIPVLTALGAGAVAVAASAAILPGAALVLGAGLLAAGIAVPVAAGSLGRRAARLEAASRGELSAELVELIAGAPELVVYGADRQRLARVRDADRRLARLARRAALADGTADGLRLAVTGATVAGVLALAVAAHADGRIGRTLIAALALLALASFEAVQPLAQAARDLQASLGAGRRILELTDREPAVADPADPAALPRGPVTVELEHVTARHATRGRPALDDVSVRLEPGRRVALVGPSGVGKTTVTNLLLRFLDPESGRIVIAGRDARDYRQDDVRRLIALAGQDSHLFSTSIRENLLISRPGATDGELEAALRRARIWDWVAALPEGLGTFVGEQGRELSGGQRQRLIVARALLADAPVLVLDEPTAHLDPPTAAALIDDVLDAAGDASVLLITHRPEGLERMDDVVVLAA